MEKKWISAVCDTTETTYVFFTTLVRDQEVEGSNIPSGRRFESHEPEIENSRSRAEVNRRDASLRVARRCAGGKPICSVRAGLRGGEGAPQGQDDTPLICNHTTIIEAEDGRNSRGYELAKWRSAFTSFSLASSARSAARYCARASPSATRFAPAPQVNSG